MQLKVKETKLHQVTTWTSEDHCYQFQIPVAEGELVLIECKPKEALLSFANLDRTKLVLYSRRYDLVTHHLKPIIISKTEKIEEDNWYVSIKTGIIDTFIGGMKPDCYFKILALPEHFSPQQLQDIVDGKLKEGKMLVECEVDREDKRNWYIDVPSGKYWEDKPIPPSRDNLYSNAIYHQVKLNPYITLHKVEKKLDTSCSIGVGDGTGQHFVYGDYESIKILQEKLLKMEKMYTAEEVEKFMWFTAQYVSKMISQDFDTVITIRDIKKVFEENIK